MWLLNTRCALNMDTRSNKAATVHYWGTEAITGKSAESTHTIRLISVYLPSLASGHDRGELRVESISCPLLSSTNTANCSASPLQSPSCPASVFNACVYVCVCVCVCMCMCSIFSYRDSVLLGLGGKEVLGHRQAGEQRGVCWCHFWGHFINLLYFSEADANCNLNCYWLITTSSPLNIYSTTQTCYSGLLVS